MNNSKLQKNHSLERETITDRKGRKRPTGKRKESAEKPQERDYESECVQSVIQTGRGVYQPPGDPGDSGLCLGEPKKPEADRGDPEEGKGAEGA